MFGEDDDVQMFGEDDDVQMFGEDDDDDVQIRGRPIIGLADYRRRY